GDTCAPEISEFPKKSSLSSNGANCHQHEIDVYQALVGRRGQSSLSAMTLPPDKNVTLRPTPRRVVGFGAALAVVALLILIAFGYCASRLTPSSLLGRNETTISHDVVVQQVKAVAKLVSSEATVRDVILYENTWYGSTKRSLVVVTGRLLAGIDLRDNPDVAIDHSNRTIRIRIPPAKLIAVEIRDMRTYDERGGLWNPFTREDRDAIQ